MSIVIQNFRPQARYSQLDATEVAIAPALLSENRFKNTLLRTHGDICPIVVVSSLTCPAAAQARANRLAIFPDASAAKR
jgi:hypothetical protein